jgi:hypothetical protein
MSGNVLGGKKQTFRPQNLQLIKKSSAIAVAMRF